MISTKTPLITPTPQPDTVATLICLGCGARRYASERYIGVLALINAMPGCAALPGCMQCGAMMVMEVYPAAAICAPVVD